TFAPIKVSEAPEQRGLLAQIVPPRRKEAPWMERRIEPKRTPIFEQPRKLSIPQRERLVDGELPVGHTEGAVAAPPLVQRLLDVGDPRHPADPQPEIVVADDVSGCRVVAAELADDRAAHHHRAMPELIRDNLCNGEVIRMGED